jgi:tetratricopeptide (TPR) repeat protein
MRECHNATKMHFIIALTMMKYCPGDQDLYAKARHICQASSLLKSRITNRSEHRRVLHNAAQMASESGARTTALWYYRHCLDLLQDDCWNASQPDVDLNENKELYIGTAEMLWSQGQNKEALDLLSELFKRTSSAACRSKAWILKSKICAQAGDHNGAMDALLTSLEELGVHLRAPDSYEQCETSYETLRAYIHSVNFEEVMLKPIIDDINVVAIGEVMGAALTVTFWGDALTFFRTIIEMINVHLFRGGFEQVGVGCALFSMVSFSRFKDQELGARMSELSLLMRDYSVNPWTRGTTLTLHNFFVSHLRAPLRTTLPTVESFLEGWLAKGDSHLTLLSLSLMASTRFYLGHDMSELEAFCSDIPNEVDTWMEDVRVGVMPLAVK